MRFLILFVFLFLVNIMGRAQRYTTRGVEQFEQRLDGSYKLYNRIANNHSTWGFYENNILVRVDEGTKIVYKIKKKDRRGKQTVYTIEVWGVQGKVIVDDSGLIIFLDEANKDVFRIVKTEKNIGSYTDDN